MYSPQMAVIVNSTVNWLYSAFETKQQYYKFVTSVFPRVTRKRIHYIKKNKPENQPEEPDNIELIAKRLELSQREIKSYYEYSKPSTGSTRTGQSI